jgi:hypothetical protein
MCLSTQATRLPFLLLNILLLLPLVTMAQQAPGGSQTTSPGINSPDTTTFSHSQTTTATASTGGSSVLEGNGLENIGFAILVVVAVVIFAGTIYLNRRRKQKAARARVHRHNALVTDVEQMGSMGTEGGYYGLGMERRLSGRTVIREEGLNGDEAPPDYYTAIRDKAPSIALSELSASGRTLGDGNEGSRGEGSGNLQRNWDLESENRAGIPVRPYPVVLAAQREGRGRE